MPAALGRLPHCAAQTMVLAPAVHSSITLEQEKLLKPFSRKICLVV